MTEITLTHREYAVLRGLASGLTQPQIARRMGRCTATVYRDIESLRAKVAANTMSHLIDRAWRLGILTATDTPMPHEKPLPSVRLVDPPEVIARRQRDLNEALNGNLRRAA